MTTDRRSGVTLLLAFFVSTVGDWIYRLAIPTLILTITGSALATAVAYMLEYLPYIVIGLVSGVVADRVNRRVLMIACDATSCVLALGIAGLTLLRHPPIAALYAAAFLLACVRPFYFPAFQGFVVDAVPEQRLATVNSWEQTEDSLLSFLGPVLGTAVIAAIGTTAATVANAASFAVSAMLVATIAYRGVRSRPDADGASANSVGKDFVEGLRTLWSLRSVFVGTLLMALANLSAFAVEGSLFYLVLTVQKLPPIALGVVFGAQGLGAVVGAVLAPRLLDRFRVGLLLSWGMGFSGLAMLIPAVVPTFVGMIVGWGLEGIATSIIVVSWFTGRQKLVPSESIGRVVAVGRAVAYVAIPFGALLGSALVAGAAPTRTLFLVAGLIQVAVFVVCLLSPLTGMGSEGQPTATSTDATEAAAHE
ncbi:MAG TPA: MFS transporter [Pseudonocardiaceae bacterium]